MSEPVANPLNGQRQSSSDEDQEDLFVSTYQNPPQSKETETKPIEEMLSTIDLNDNNDDSVSGDNENNDGGHSQLTESNSNEPVVPATVQSQQSSVNLVSSTSASSTSPVSPLVLSNESPVLDNVQAPNVTKKSPAMNTASQISITISDPHKIGEGMGSYMVYTVKTTTTLPYFRRQSLSVNRRFSDFLGLHDKLVEKHTHCGRFVPPPPAKNAVGTAKIKMAKSDENLSSMEFLEKRRAALERYLQRNAEHPIICADPDFREFLELDTELPRSTSTSALSGAGVKRLFSFVGDTVNKITFRMDESDPALSNSLHDIKWFESKQAQIDSLDTQLRKLYTSVESLIHYRKELTNATGNLAKSTAILGNCEEHNSLSCALSQLAATQEKIEKVYEKQSNNDIIYLAELLKDYIALIGSVKEAFQERIKCFQNMTITEQNLNKKRELKAKLELALKNDRVPQVEEEIREIESKLEKFKDDFENISSTIKQEFERFEINRIRDFKNNFLRYMESLLEAQESLVDCWESFLPEAKSIAA